MERKTVQVRQSIKNALQELKEKIKVSNESETIGYLYALYEGSYKNIKLVDHEAAIKRMRELHDQETL